ncbi:MAG: hypothetical protein K2Q10_06015, partial [Rhodospirillales bacterium]|nr:hypothetical protein [Rhodospirillales bacterium]
MDRGSKGDFLHLRRRLLTSTAIGLCLATALAGSALALPQDGKVVAGEVRIEQPAPTRLDIKQGSD